MGISLTLYCYKKLEKNCKNLQILVYSKSFKFLKATLFLFFNWDTSYSRNNEYAKKVYVSPTSFLNV